MARKKRRRPEPDRPAGDEPMLVHCVLRIPSSQAGELLPQLGIAFDCGGATLKRKRNIIEIEADVDVRTVADIVAKGVPVLVTERVKIEPIRRHELTRNASSWLQHMSRLK